MKSCLKEVHLKKLDMVTEICEWTDGADLEKELVNAGMRGETGAGGRDSRRSLSVYI